MLPWTLNCMNQRLVRTEDEKDKIQKQLKHIGYIHKCVYVYEYENHCGENDKSKHIDV